ncbi:methionine--tRNA ligase [Candidatus Azambacteria bacterium]|nr:methionine--tRNA ligase [Candidatus Azambacteria bacterium]
MSKFYITTSIAYVNADPHIGHCLEYVQADVVARYHRIKGDEVFFLTGTDEQSLKNAQAAEKAGLSVEDLVMKYYQRFKEIGRLLNISVDDFIRTTEGRHIKGAQKLWLACQKDIYKKTYQGLYCVGCEEFYQEAELVDGFCPDHQVKPELIKEENYFFRLSAYQDQIKKNLESEVIEIIPRFRKNEILSFIDRDLEDICISRSRERSRGWGIDVPGDPTQKMWVWFDALSNYINALGYSGDENNFDQWWQKNDDKLHMIGKGILRFHALYWPGLLLSANLALPKKIFVHGYLTIEGQKMSKSLGNVIDPFELIKKYGTDPVRYYLLREFSSFQDGDFSIGRLEKRYQDDLAHGLSNLIHRVLSLVWNNRGLFNLEKLSLDAGHSRPAKRGGNLDSRKILDPRLRGDDKIKTIETYNNLLENFEFNKVLDLVWTVIKETDQKIDQLKIWELAKTDSEKFVLESVSLIESFYFIAYLLKPFLPETSEKILELIKMDKEPVPLFK